MAQETPSSAQSENDVRVADAVNLRDHLERAEHILAVLEKGVAVLDSDFRISWANQPFRAWCSSEPNGKTLLDALGDVSLVSPEVIPTEGILAGKTAVLRLQHRGNRYLDVTITPFREGDRQVEPIALCSDVTAAVVRQQKLDALHRAGQELAALDADELSEMTVDDRVELLKQNLRRHIHDLLHYNVMEIRLLELSSGELKPLLEEGMMPEAAKRILFARAEENGVTGFVAATGQSYLCRDTEHDPHYIKGAEGARSSMTVPLVFQDAVIGTFNVESPTANAFGAEDLQFAELFSREIAQALNTLNLLRAQQSCTASQAIEAVNREIALTGDELLSIACSMLEQIGAQPELAGPLLRIIADARTIKQSIQNVGEEFARALPNAKVPVLLRGMRILVIDSDDRIRRAAHALLEREGCQVETAATGQEGLALARASQYDAMLMAIRHPDIGGTLLYRTLRELQPAGRVILTQGFEYDGSHTLVNVRQDGYSLPILYKPFQPNQLFKALTCLLSADPHRSEIIQTS